MRLKAVLLVVASIRRLKGEIVCLWGRTQCCLFLRPVRDTEGGTLGDSSAPKRDQWGKCPKHEQGSVQA
jgi:hypothetical protein